MEEHKGLDKNRLGSAGGVADGADGEGRTRDADNGIQQDGSGDPANTLRGEGAPGNVDEVLRKATEDLNAIRDYFTDLRTTADEVLARLRAAQENIRRLLANVGGAGKCRGCGADMYWVRHLNDKMTPYNADGTNHFSTCPEAKTFKKGGA